MKIFVLKPAEAPLGTQRLLPLLRKCLANPGYSTCRIIVAFARLSGVARLLPDIRAWRSRGHLIEAIVGIDLFGTSHEALQVMLDEFDAVYITRTTHQSCTFHPKMYLFRGRRHAQASRETAAAKERMMPAAQSLFPAIAPAPPSPLPKDVVPGLRPSKAPKAKAVQQLAVEQPKTVEGLPRGLVIEIIPHHIGTNGQTRFSYSM